MKDHLFHVIEGSRKGKEEYSLMMTDEEMARYLKGKEEMNGYIPGPGGDKSYYIVAWYERLY